ncbi:MAG: CBS domain-containing protein [Planctomycetes bacterium]|nr:CBS domain-containing protein [Planctomycetota bacterium]
MKTVRDILRSKGNDVFSIAPDATVFDALKLMERLSVGALIVLEKGALAGVFSERDYARKVILRGLASQELAVRQVMSSEVHVVRPDQSVDECMQLMTDRHVRHLPVVEGRSVIGVVSIGDLVKAQISEQQRLIEQLEGYIRGA